MGCGVWGVGMGVDGCFTDFLQTVYVYQYYVCLLSREQFQWRQMQWWQAQQYCALRPNQRTVYLITKFKKEINTIVVLDRYHMCHNGHN